MKQYNYDITLSTPLGDKSGVMNVYVDNETIKGILKVLTKENNFTGKILANGKCELFGEIKTPVRKIVYTAIGILKEDGVNLSLRSTCDRLLINGTVCKDIGGNCNAEILS